MKELIALFLVLTIVLNACRKDSHVVEEPALEIAEEELITSLLVQLYRTDVPGDTLTFAFRDADGPSGMPPSMVDSIRLSTYGQYACILQVLDESAELTRDISIEILAEANDHLFCFESVNIPITIIRTDSDGLYELGLQSQWTTFATGMGEVQISLKHQPGIKNGTCEPGETDIEVTFPILVE